jgi:hypothetical protein
MIGKKRKRGGLGLSVILLTYLPSLLSLFLLIPSSLSLVHRTGLY